MAEILTYSTPQQGTAVTTVQIVGMEMYREPAPLVRFILKDNNGLVFDARYTQEEGALDLIKLFNTMNFSTTSLNKRALAKLATDGKLAPGAVSGADNGV